VTISVLGPFRVDGDGSSLEPRDRVVLEVLALRPGEVVSAERLADAMWSDVPPPTWHKVVQGCIVRLRKVLGAGAIETSPAGYCLATPPEQVDMHRFERMARRGMELLALGEYDRAAYVSGEALTLWRGPALRELEDWDTGRIEAGRLEELRLDAEEVRVEAALRAGHHREVLAEAQARAAEAPLRERRWALLALAQYQVGRQGDALRTLHRARMTLVAQLGIEPGSELVALEQAILRQDPSLVVAAALPQPSAVCPYLGLVPYDVADSEGFFGREREVKACLDRLNTVGVLMVVGPSGSGKSSLVRAGVAASLQRNGRRVVVITPGARPIDALSDLPASGAAPVLVVDQCEEAVTLCDDPADQARFFAALAAHAEHAPLVVALRADRLGELSGHPDFAHLVEPGLHLLSAMTEGELRAAIEGPARQAGLLLEPGLVDLLVREVEGEPGALPLLSHALLETWERREGRTLTVDGYQETGGIRGAVAQSAEEVYGQVPEAQQPLLRDLLLRLVTPTPEGEPVRSRVPRRTVATDADHEQLVELLVGARLVTSDDDTVELAHESLARAWPRLQSWLDDDVEGQRIRRHLALAADAWDGMGRPDSEFYRGVRLGQALDWQRTASPDLTPAERAFLDASAQRERAEAATTEQRLREQTRHNRRLRAVLIGAAVLLVVALVAGLVAFRQANRADRAADAADARRVGAQALLVDDLDHSLLLAAEGVRLDDSTDTRSNLLAALSRGPEVIAATGTDGPPLISVEVSPDGNVVGVGSAYNGLSFYDPSSRGLLGTYDELPVWQFEFHPDGTQIALSGQPGAAAATVLAQPSLRLVDAATFKDQPIQLGGIPESEFVSAPHYSANGRFLGAAFEGTRGGDDSTVVVWNMASMQQPVLQLDVPGPEYELALSPDGSLLYVGHDDPPSVTVYEVATGRSLHSVRLPGTWLEVSPDGSLLAATGGNEIVLLDAATLTERRRLEGHSDHVRAIRFSPSGRLLASGSDDRTAIVWDVTSGERRDLLRGNSAEVWGVSFGPDDDTLYTASGRTLLTWDLEGGRRFIARHPAPERATRAIRAGISPTGEAVAYTGCSTAGGPAPLDFLDLGAGRAGPVIETGVWCDGASAWRPDGDRYATAGDDGFVRVWNWRTGQLINERHVAATPIIGLDYTEDGQRLVVAERTGTTYAIDAETLESDGPAIRLDQPVVAVYASPDSHTAVLHTTDRFTVVDLDNGQVIHEGEAAGAFSGEFSPDGRRFVVGDTSGSVRVLDVQTGEWTGPPRVGHDGPILSVDYAPDGATFASGALDDAIVLWDADSGAPLNKVLPGRPTDGEMTPMFLADGHTVLIASTGGAVYTMDTSPEHWIEVACAIAGRNLTQNEWRDAFDDRPYRETCPSQRQG
jgi:WD40 repeat protein/DNA-binding SARP family transcriptional activator/energy-coupling factor transporter ATP-binding protein EcfA2